MPEQEPCARILIIGLDESLSSAIACSPSPAASSAFARSSTSSGSCGKSLSACARPSSTGAPSLAASAARARRLRAAGLVSFANVFSARIARVLRRQILVAPLPRASSSRDINERTRRLRFGAAASSVAALSGSFASSARRPRPNAGNASAPSAGGAAMRTPSIAKARRERCRIRREQCGGVGALERNALRRCRAARYGPCEIEQRGRCRRAELAAENARRIRRARDVGQLLRATHRREDRAPPARSRLRTRARETTAMRADRSAAIRARALRARARARRAPHRRRVP